MSKMEKSSQSKKDTISEAKNFCDGLSNVFMLKKRDPQTRHLLEKAKSLIETLMAENQRQSKTTGSSVGSPRQTRSGGGMGQLWVKLDEMKRENEDLRKQLGKSQDERGGSSKLQQGPGEVIIGEMQKYKQENEILKGKVDKLTRNVKEMESINTSVQDEYKRAKIALEATQKSMETILKDYRQMEDSLKSAKSENDSLKQSRQTHSVKPLPKPVPKARITNSIHVENLSEKCRSSNVAMLYNTLESQEWVDAKEALEDDFDFEEESIIQFLCTILMVSFKTCKEVHETLRATLAEILRKPTLAVSLDFGGQINYKYKLPENLSDGVGQQLRQHYDDIDTATIVNIISKKLAIDQRAFVENNCLQHKSISRYMHACVKVTWQMIIQQPQMFLTVDDEQFDDNKHRLWWSCDQKSAKSIEFFIWPALYDHRNGILQVKGCVYAS